MQKIKRCGFFITLIFLDFFGLAFSKEDTPLDLESIVITKGAAHLLNSYSVESDTIEKLPFNSLVETLNILPLDLQSRSPRGAIQADFSLRGSTFQGVLILIDGQRINDPQTGHHNADIPLTREDVERIEVIPGAGSSIFGPDAIGGAVNINLKGPKTKKVVLETSFGQYRTKYGLFSVSDKRDNLAVRLSLENQESAGFYDDTDFKKFTAALYSILDIPSGTFNLNLGYLEKEFGAYDFYTPQSGYLSKEWTKTFLLNTGLNLEKHGFIIKPNFLWRRHYDKFMLDKTLSRSNYLNHHRTDIYTPNIYLQNQTSFLGRVGFGFEYGQENIDSTNLGKHKRNRKSIFMDESKDLGDRLSFGLSFRIDDFDGFDLLHTGSFNFKRRFSKEDSIHLGVSRSIRIPSFTELYYNDPTTLGKINLSVEKSFGYEIGYDYKKEGLSAGVTLFLREERDFIDWIKRSSTQTKWEVENITEAEVWGIESHLKFKINNYTDLDYNYTYIDKRLNDRGLIYKYGPNYIRHLVNTALFFKLPFGTQSLGLTFKRKPHRDGWLLLNSRLSRNLSKNSQLFLGITNFLNVEYQEIEGIPQPGRWVEAGIRFAW